jgi:hypothetical protein
VTHTCKMTREKKEQDSLVVEEDFARLLEVKDLTRVVWGCDDFCGHRVHCYLLATHERHAGGRWWCGWGQEEVVFAGGGGRTECFGVGSRGWVAVRVAPVVGVVKESGRRVAQ